MRVDQQRDARRRPRPRHSRPDGSRRHARAERRRDRRADRSRDWSRTLSTLLTSSSSPQPVRRAISRQKLGLGDRAFREQDVGRGVFEQHAPAERFLRFIDMRADAGERLLGIGQRQQVVEEAEIVARPRQMLREQPRLVAFRERGQARQMRPCRAVAASRSTGRRRAGTADRATGSPPAGDAAGRRRPCNFPRGFRKIRRPAARRGSCRHVRASGRRPPGSAAARRRADGLGTARASSSAAAFVGFFAPGPTHVTRRGQAVRSVFFRPRPPAP